MNRRGTVEVAITASIIAISGIIIGKVMPFIAPALGAFAIYFYTVSENHELRFSIRKAVSGIGCYNVFGQALTYILSYKFGIEDEEMTFYMGVIIGGLTPIILMIFTDKEFIANKLKALINKISGD